MSIEKLPDPIFIQILELLPLKQQIVIGRVSKTFRRMSIAVIARTRSLILVYKQPNSLWPTPDGLSRLLQLCHGRLEKVTFAKRYYCRLLEMGLLAKLAEFSYPNLIDLDIGAIEPSDAILTALLTNSPNLRVFRSLYDQYSGLQFPEVYCKSLETLQLNFIWFGDVVQRIARNCPNLKRFEFYHLAGNKKKWDELCTQCYRLESIQILNSSDNLHNDIDQIFNLEPSAPFWRLSAMRSLKILLSSDDVLIRISENFALMESLDLCINDDVTLEGIATMTSLKNLRFVKIKIWGHPDFNDRIAPLADCENLEELELPFNLTAATFLKIVRSCHGLKRFHIKNLGDVKSTEDAVAVIQSLREFCEFRLTKLRIRILWEFFSHDPWGSEEAQVAISELDAMESGMIELCITFWKSTNRGDDR